MTMPAGPAPTQVPDSSPNGHGPAAGETPVIPAEASVRLLRCISQLTSQDSDSTTIFSATLDLVRQMLRVERASILLLHAREGFLRMRAAIGIPESEWGQVRIPVGVGIAGRLVEDRVPVLVPDIRSSDFASLARTDHHYGSQSFMAAPVIVQEHVVGVLCATGAGDGPAWTTTDLDVLVAIAGYLGTAVGSTQVIRSSQASLTHLKDVLAQVRMGLITVGMDQRVTMITAPARQMLGLMQHDDPDGWEVVGLFDDADGTLAKCLGETLEFFAETTCEVQPANPQGTNGAALGVVLVPLVDEHAQPAGALLTLSSLEIRDEVEKLRQLDELKSVFLATLSHEFRTPLTALGGAVYLLENTQQDEHQVHLTGIIRRNTRRLNRLLGNLIELVQLQNGALQCTPTAVDLADVARDHLDDARETMEERQQSFTSQLDPAPTVVDAALLGRIISELLDNAAKFSPVNGAIHMATGWDRSLGEVWLEVRDSGPGVDQTLRRSLFEGFRQAEHYMTRSISGLGLGLNLAWQLVRLQNGRLEELGQPDSGAVFRATFPARTAPELGQH
jgi:signal transduction histidine kinase